jgi:hypothetical protein
LFDATVAAKLVLMTTDMVSSLILECDVRVAFGSWLAALERTGLVSDSRQVK